MIRAGTIDSVTMISLSTPAGSLSGMTTEVSEVYFFPSPPLPPASGSYLLFFTPDTPMISWVSVPQLFQVSMACLFMALMMLNQV